MYEKIIAKFWNDPKQVKSFGDDQPSEYLMKFFSTIKNPVGKKVLDIGCGGGRNTEMLLKMGFDIFACDLHKAMVNFTKKRISKINKKEEKKIILASMTSLPYPDNFFDYVVSSGVFHNAANFNKFSLAIKEAQRVLKNSGYLILNIFINDWLGKKLKKKRKSRFFYFTNNGLPIILLPLYKLIEIFSENNLKLLSFFQEKVFLSMGEREIFKAIFQKNQKLQIGELKIINLRKLIDKYDREIIQLIFKRIKLVQTIFKNKISEELPLLDIKREKEIKLNLIKFAKYSGFNIKKRKIKEFADFLLKFSRDY